jgi:hypothetical protein
MRIQQARTVLVVALAVAAAPFLGVGTAAADHTIDVDVTGSGCVKGGMALGIPIKLETDRSIVRTRGDGSVRATCHFKGLPERIDSEDFGTWVRPSVATRLADGICALHGEGLELVFGDGTALVTPAGTLKVECTFTAPFTGPDA